MRRCSRVLYAVKLAETRWDHNFFSKLRRFLSSSSGSEDNSGEMQEWFNWHAWKACVPQKGTGGSNPFLSANHDLTPPLAGFFILTTTRCKLACISGGGKINNTQRVSHGFAGSLRRITAGNPFLSANSYECQAVFDGLVPFFYGRGSGSLLTLNLT